jgi:pyrroloquinoline-quinone synthase
LEHLALTKAHRAVEGEHRQAAWQTLLEYVSEHERARVVAGMESALRHWHDYRDAVAIACGLVRP